MADTFDKALDTLIDLISIRNTRVQKYTELKGDKDISSKLRPLDVQYAVVKKKFINLIEEEGK